MKKLLMSFFFFCFYFNAWLLANQDEYAIVFVHIGKELPSYLETSLTQARLFNKKSPIILIANQEALNKLSANLSSQQIKTIPCESLQKTLEHEAFLRDFPPSDFREGFWTYTIERFLYLNDLLSQHKLNNVFHLENDVMLYVDLGELLPVFRRHYKGIASTFDNDQRCIPGFFFIQNPEAMHKLAIFFAQQAKYGKNDMQVVGLFEKEYDKATIDFLPIIMSEYRDTHRLVSRAGHTPHTPERYSNHMDSFKSIFDAAALGQYLGGIDRRNADIGAGFVNESCVFDPSYLKFVWETDQEGRKIPFALFKDNKFRINNLHIHSKMLHNFSSLPLSKTPTTNSALNSEAPKDVLKKVYLFTKDPIDVVIPSTEKDLDTLNLSIAAIKANCNQIRRVIVVSPSRLTDQAEWFDEKKFPFTKFDVAMEMFDHKEDVVRRYNVSWFYQQLLKLYAPFVIPDISSNVLILDSDTIFLNPVEFIGPSGAGFLNPGTEYHLPYFVHMNKLIPGLKKVFEQHSGISHHMLFQKCILDDLFHTIESIHKVPTWKAFCRNVDISQSFFAASEYEIYFNFVLSRNDQVAIRPLKWQNTSRLEDLPKFKEEGYDYVSCHQWMRAQAANGVPHP